MDDLVERIGMTSSGVSVGAVRDGIEGNDPADAGQTFVRVMLYASAAASGAGRD